MSVTMVGDLAQSIYGWRASKPFLFANFKNLFPERVKEHTILKNYRTPRQLVLIANAFRKIFEENGIDYTPAVPHLKNMPETLSILDFETPEEEITHILREIKYKHDVEGIPYSEFSILCRTNNEISSFESGVVSLGIPYYFKFDNQSIMAQSGFKYLYSLYSMMLDPENVLNFWELIQPIKGVGVKFIEKIKKAYTNKNTPLLEFFSVKNKSNLPNSNYKQWDSIFSFIERVLKPLLAERETKLNYPSINRLILRLLNNFYYFEEDVPTLGGVGVFLKRKQLIEVFNTLSTLYEVSCEDAEFKKLSNWEQFVQIYENLQLSQDVHIEMKEKKVAKADRDALGFYTIHSYKGKENNYIYYAKTRGLWQLDYYDFESRCVFYVAITRSKRKLTISGSEMVKGFDNTYKGSYENPFVEDLKSLISEIDFTEECV
jgi:DNA helicase-2/ATP-dependent DNA helicase PcrA